MSSRRDSTNTSTVMRARWKKVVCRRREIRQMSSRLSLGSMKPSGTISLVLNLPTFRTVVRKVETKLRQRKSSRGLRKIRANWRAVSDKTGEVDRATRVIFRDTISRTQIGPRTLARRSRTMTW